MFLNLNKIGEFSDTSFYDCQIAIQNCVQFCSWFTITNLQPLTIYMGVQMERNGHCVQ